MKQRNQVAVVSIGSSEIIFTLVEVFESEDGQTLLLEVLVSVASKADGILQGKITNPALFKESLSKALEDARGVYQWDGFERFILCFGGEPIVGMVSNGMISLRNRDGSSVATTLEMNHKVIEIATASPRLINNELLHIFLCSVSVDEMEPVQREPVIGLQASARLDANVFLVACNKDEYKKYVDCVSECFTGHPIDRVIAAPVASSYAVLTSNDKLSNVMMVDIGAGTTDVMVYSEGVLVYTAVIPLGGDHVTRAIASVFKCSMEMAENVKTTKGGAICPKGERMYEISRQLGSENFSAKKGDLFDVIYRACFDIFSEVLSALLGSINSSTLAEFVDNFTAAGIVITGGSARIPNIEQVPNLLIHSFQAGLDVVPVRIGLLEAPPSPKKRWKHVSYADSVSDIRKCPENAAAIGAILCHLSEEDYIYLEKKEASESWLTLVWRKIKDSFFSVFYT